MKYLVTVSGISLADANEVIRFCSGRGFGIPEIMEDSRIEPQVHGKGALPLFPSAPVRHRRPRREIVMTVVSGRGESFSGCARDVAAHIAESTGRGVSAARMMTHFRRGEQFRGFSAIITKDSHRPRKDNARPVAEEVAQ